MKNVFVTFDCDLTAFDGVKIGKAEVLIDLDEYVEDTVGSDPPLSSSRTRDLVRTQRSLGTEIVRSCFRKGIGTQTQESE